METRRRHRVRGLQAYGVALAGVIGLGTIAWPGGATAATATARGVTVGTSATRAQPPVAATDDVIAVAGAAALARLWANDDAGYRTALETLVPLVAVRAKVRSVALRAAWSGADRRRMIALLAALTQLGVPYRRNTQIEGQGFDCSALTSWAWGVAGVKLSRSRVTQLTQLLPSTTVGAQPGDILAYPGHVMLALGVGEAMLDAPFTGRWVQVRAMYPSKVGKVSVLSPP